MSETRHSYCVLRIAYIEALNTKSEALNKSKIQMTKQARKSRSGKV